MVFGGATLIKKLRSRADLSNVLGGVMSENFKHGGTNEKKIAAFASKNCRLV